jgi:MFS family permease
VQTPKAAGYGFGASITRSGLMMLPSTVTMFITGMFAGRLTRVLGGKVLVFAGCLIGAASMAILAFAHHHEWEIFLSNAIMGVGFGLAFSAMSALVVMAGIVTSSLEASGLPKEAGYTIGFAVLAAGLLLAALAATLIPSARRLGRGAGEPELGAVTVTAGESMAGDIPRDI